jgi:hypothetical protein
MRKLITKLANYEGSGFNAVFDYNSYSVLEYSYGETPDYKIKECFTADDDPQDYGENLGRDFVRMYERELQSLFDRLEKEGYWHDVAEDPASYEDLFWDAYYSSVWSEGLPEAIRRHDMNWGTDVVSWQNEGSYNSADEWVEDQTTMLFSSLINWAEDEFVMSNNKPFVRFCEKYIYALKEERDNKMVEDLGELTGPGVELLRKTFKLNGKSNINVLDDGRETSKKLKVRNASGAEAQVQVTGSKFRFTVKWQGTTVTGVTSTYVDSLGCVEMTLRAIKAHGAKQVDSTINYNVKLQMGLKKRGVRIERTAKMNRKSSRNNSFSKRRKASTQSRVASYEVTVDCMDPKSRTLRRLLDKNGVTMDVVGRGPAGLAECRLVGEKRDLVNVLRSPEGWGDADLADFIEPARGGRRASTQSRVASYEVTVDCMDPKSRTLRRLLDKNGVSMDVTGRGPAGFAECRLVGEKRDLVNVLRSPEGWGDADLADFIEPARGGRRASTQNRVASYEVTVDCMDPKSRTLRRLLDKNGVTMDVTGRGPAGFAECRLVGEKRDLVNVLRSPEGWGDADLADFIEPARGGRRASTQNRVASYEVTVDCMDPKSRTLRRLLDKNGVTLKVTGRGPAGFAECLLVGEKRDLVNVLRSPEGWDDADLADFIEPARGGRRASTQRAAAGEYEIIVDSVDPKSRGLKRLLSLNNVSSDVLGRGASGHTEMRLFGRRKDLAKVLRSPEGWDSEYLVGLIQPTMTREMGGYHSYRPGRRGLPKT